MKRPLRLLLPAVVLPLTLVPGPARSQVSRDGGAPREILTLPADDIGVRTLQIRRDLQIKNRDQIGVFTDFTFSDLVTDSGITFVHQVTEDNGRKMKPVHYDHANGLAVADVDGDGLYDIYFLSQIGSNELWKNLGGGRFRNITAEAGVGLAERISVAGSFADVDNDGDADLYVTTVRMGNVFFRNDGKGRFTDATEEVGLGHSGHSSGAVFFDYDRDGLLDCFLTNVGVYTTDEIGPGPYYVGREDAFLGHQFPERTETSVLFKNLGGGKMRDVSEATGLLDTGWSGDATFADLNDDGYPDLYVLSMQGGDHYWENVGGKRFRERTKDLFPKTPWGAMGVKFFDYDNDGLLDLVVTDMHSDMTESSGIEREKLKARVPQAEPDAYIYGNALYHNLGEGKFEEISDSLGVENYWPWGVSAGDLNADGFEDLFFSSSMSYPFRYSINSVLLNDRGRKFVDSEFILGVEPRKDDATHVPWFVLDCSGEDREHESCAGRDGEVQVMGTLGTRATALFDLDDDGDLDIVSLEFGAPPQVLISNLSERRPVRFLKVRLVGRESNRDGLGAVVAVTAGETTWTKVHDGKSGYLTQSSLPLYFGLGEATSIDRVAVRWPSGKEQVITSGLLIDRLMVIEER